MNPKFEARFGDYILLTLAMLNTWRCYSPSTDFWRLANRILPHSAGRRMTGPYPGLESPHTCQLQGSIKFVISIGSVWGPYTVSFFARLHYSDGESRPPTAGGCSPNECLKDTVVTGHGHQGAFNRPIALREPRLD
jgi:hypothetical protein